MGQSAILLVSMFLVNLVSSENVVNFDRENFAVLLNPEVAPLGYEADNARTTSSICREEDIFPLLRKVKERFSIVAFKTTNSRDIRKISYDCLPSAVAKLNKIWEEEGSSTMKVWLVDSVAPVYVQTDADFTSRLDNISTVVKEANSQFPGTVPLVLLDYYSYIHDGEDTQAKENAEKHLSMSLDLFGDDVQTGLVLSNSFCQYLYYYPHRPTFITKADVVLFADFEPGLPSTSIKPEDYASETYTKCVTSIDTLYGKKTQLGVYTAWPTTTPTGLTSYSYFVGVWEALNKWAKDNKKPVLMWGAFDDLARPNIPWSSLGWWRLLPNSSYVNTSDYEFVEKTSLVEDSNIPTDPMETTELFINATTNFSRMNFGVELDPFVHLFENGVRGRQVPVHSLVNQVATLFSRIRVPPIQGKDVHHSVVQLWKAVNKWNSEIPLQLELVMTFSPNKIAFDTTADIVRKSKSVKLILLDATGKSEKMDELELENILKHAKTNIPSNTTSLGVILNADLISYKIGKKNFNRIAPLLKYVSALYIQTYIPPERLHLGVDRVHSDVTTFFEKFEEKAKVRFPHLKEIGFLTNWHDADGNGKQNYIQLVNFWERMNDWAVRKSKKVIMKEAFDNPNGGKDSTQGWWRLVQDKNRDWEYETLLEEKKSVTSKPTGASGPQCKCWSPYD